MLEFDSVFGRAICRADSDHSSDPASRLHVLFLADARCLSAPHLREKVLLSPHDEGVRFPEYARLWAELSPFEKCLYYWAEVHAFALDLQTRLDARWLRLKYEDVFGGDGIQQLLSFLELPAREVVFEQRTTHVDQFRYLTGAWQDWRLVRKHPHVVRVASQLGYDTDQVDEDALNRRYHSPRGPNPG